MIKMKLFVPIFKLIKNNPIISLIVFIALVLRIYGIYPGYPDIHPDESSSYSTSVHLLYNFLKPDRFDYPAGVPFINAIVYVVFFIPLYVLKIIFYNSDALLQFIFNPHNFFVQHKEEIFGNRDFYAMYWTRIITAVFGTASVLLLYFTGKKLFNKEVGIFAAFFLAVNYLHVVRSHFGLPDTYNGFFLVLMLLICSRLLKKDSLKNYIFAGIVGGLAFSLKYQLFAFLPFFLTHLLIVLKRKKPLLLFRWEFIFSLIIAGLTFLLVNPYYLFNIAEAMKQNANDIRRYQMGNIFFRPYSYFYLFYWGIGSLASISIVLGMILMAIRSPRNWLILMSFVFTFFFVMTYYGQGGIFTRNFANVMPYLMLFAGYGMYVLLGLFKNKYKHTLLAKVLIIVLMLGINFSSIKNSLILDKYYSMPWNETKLSEWLRDQLPKNTVVRNYQMFFHAVGGQAVIDKQFFMKDWDYSKGPNSLAEFQEEETDFAILNTNPLQSITYWWRGYPELFLKYNTVPFDFIENGFHGLSIKELLRYTVFEAYKPWQSHYENNYLVFKIPKKPKDFEKLGKKIANFTFDTKEDIWQLRGDFGLGSMKASWIEGTLVATSSGTTSRLSSPAISVKEGLQYSVRGNIKTSAQTDGERDGFLRIDFYSDDKKDTLEKIGIIVAISSRAHAIGEWTNIQASMIAPKGSKFMTVSFQFKNAYFTSMFDDIEVFESSTKPIERFKEIPYIKSTIPLESLYYNTFI